MKGPNIRLRPNILCTALWSEEEILVAKLSRDQELKRLDYWELLELGRINPIKYPFSSLRDNLTPLQQAQRDAFMQPRMRSLWPDFSRFRPLVVHKQRPPVPDVVELPSKPVRTGFAKSQKPPLPSVPEITHKEKDPQKKVVDEPACSKIIVLAPPGTGKTHVLIERLSRIIESGEIDNPAEEVVVLSFTNAAVAEVTGRVLQKTRKSAQDDLRYVNVRTFDSFATWLLMKVYSPDELSTMGFEERIREFSRLLKAGTSSKALSEVDSIRCLLVDEIQDVTGPRAEMVIEMAKRIVANGGGVTLLGDPAQAIYDWSVDGDDYTSADFLREIRNILGVEVTEIQLEKYFRFASDSMKKIAEGARRAMGEDGSRPDGTLLFGMLAGLPVIPGLEEVADAPGGESRAVLTRNNLEAWQIYKWCDKNGVRCSLNQGASGIQWPGWIGRLAFGFQNEKMSRKQAQKRWRGMGIAEREAYSFDEAWAFLMEQGAADQSTLDLGILSERIMRRSPVSPGQGKDDCLLVSTIHKSKGLEFENVVLLMPQEDHIDNYEVVKFEETRVLYVAATRAKSTLKLLERNQSIFYTGKKYNSSISHFHTFKDKVNRILLDGVSDLDKETLLSPKGVGRSSLPDTIKTVQDNVWTVISGRNQNLAAERREDDYVLVISDQSGRTFPVCNLSRTVKRDLFYLGCRFRGKRDAVTGLSNIPVTGLATVAFPTNQAATRLLGAACLAVVPVLHGEACMTMTEGDG